MPLSGKTYWAKKLSVELRLPYIDMDAEIELFRNDTVRNIFAKEGEVAFRKYEHHVLCNVVSKQNAETMIVGCGGGLPVFHNNMQMMKKEGCVIYLKADIELLTQRFENIEERNNRPLLADVTEIEILLARLLKERKNIYDQADYVLDVRTVSVSTFEEIIKSCIEDH